MRGAGLAVVLLLVWALMMIGLFWVIAKADDITQHMPPDLRRRTQRR